MVTGYFDKVLSLGKACEVAYQIRRNFPEQPESYFFDWLGTNKKGLLSILRADFEDFIAEEQIQPTRGVDPRGRYQHVIQRTYGITMRHHFPADAPIAAGIPQNREKFAYLLQRWRGTLDTGKRILFIRRDTDASEGYKAAPGGRAAFIDQVAAELDRLYPGLDFQLLHIVETDSGPAAEDPRVTRALMPPSPKWTGEHDAWTEALAPVRVVQAQEETV